MSEEQAAYEAETHGKGYDMENVVRDLPSTLSGFTPAPDVLIKSYGYVTALVWGRMWRYCQMSDGVCRAKIETIAAELGMSDRTIIRHIDPLVEDGYLKDMTPDLKNRPHIYADTGKLRIKISIEATMTESQSRVTQSQSTMTLSQSQGDRESHEESIKKQGKRKDNSARKHELAGGSVQAAIYAGTQVTQTMLDAAKARDLAPKAFEAALGFSNALPWWSNTDWTRFADWVVDRYIADPRIFEKYETWRNTPFVKGSISNNRIRGFVKEFYDSFDMFMKSEKPEAYTIPEQKKTPFEQALENPEPLSKEQEEALKEARERWRTKAKVPA